MASSMYIQTLWSRRSLFFLPAIGNGINLILTFGPISFVWKGCLFYSRGICPITPVGDRHHCWRQIILEVHFHSRLVATVGSTAGFLEQAGTPTRVHWVANFKRSSVGLMDRGANDLSRRCCCVLDKRSVRLVDIMVISPDRPCQLP